MINLESKNSDTKQVIIMFFVTGIALFLTVGFGLIVAVPLCMIWAYFAAKKSNEVNVSTL
ncbi:MAG: hypothetical protein HF967_01670 [Methanosarcinales archaeon]|nr:hypothetical protein [Methanosarcinales archaeon]